MSGDGMDAGFEALLEHLRRSRGFDFTGYKRSSLMRRVNKRMMMLGVAEYTSYVDYLEVHPEEFGHLFDTILINVTSFFRDPQAWEVLAAEMVPRLLAGKREGEPIRVWSAGCATGEEAYTLAMILAEALGPEQARDRLKIYATDADEPALARARQAQYEAGEIEAVPPELRDRYFEAFNGHFTFQKELRRSVIFGRHDLIQDAPISRIDLLTCRNTLMYFNSETQARILDRFHFALNDRGFLFLGKAETLLTYNNTYSAVDLKRRIFAKVPRGNPRDRMLTLARAGAEEPGNHLISHVRIREAAFESATVAQLVVDFSGLLVLANDRARTLFNLTPADLGRPLQDAQISYRPAELRSCIDRAYADRRPVVLQEVEWSGGTAAPCMLNIHVVPLLDPADNPLGVSVSFIDVTDTKTLKDALQTANRELETAYEELQSTNEELETTNEELQSTIEELETTNEELQSTNEELETMNEELQSTNEELETVNEELRRRSDELKQSNAFLEAILGSLRGAVVVLDPDFLVLVWNPRAEELWGLRSGEVLGKNLLNLDFGLPVFSLRPAILACLAGEVAHQQVDLEAINRRGKPIRCRVICTPMRYGAEISGAILMLVDADAASAAADFGGYGESP